MPTDKTKAEYRRLARHFIEKRLGGQSPTPKRLTDALQACAGEYRPAYWRRLRCALVLDQEERGYRKGAERIKGTRNPVTTGRDGRPLLAEERTSVKPKQRRAKSIAKEDRARLLRAAKALDDGDETRAAVVLAESLGVRPAEMAGLQVDQERGTVWVTGAKRSGVRGADRELTLPDDPKARANIARAVRIIQRAEKRQPGAMRRIQSRLDRVSRKLWPRRQARPSLYTFRHQMGANLKGLGLDRRAIAYIMGHQSTQSVEVYGDRRKSRGGIGISLTGQEVNRFQGRENHRPAPDGMPESKVPPALREQPEKPAESGSEPDLPKPVPGPGSNGPGPNM